MPSGSGNTRFVRPMSFANAPATCSRSVGVVRLPAEPADDASRCCDRIPHHVDAAGDAIAVGVVGIGERAQRVLGNRFEQAEAEHRRRHAIRELRARGQRSPVGARDVEARLAHRDDLAVAVRDSRVSIHVSVDGHLGQADRRVILELRAEARAPAPGRRERRASPSAG